MNYYNSHFVFEGVKDNTLVNGDYLYQEIGVIHTSLQEMREKAKELFAKNKFDGILLRIFRNNVHEDTVKYYELYYNGKKFIKNPDFLYWTDPFTKEKHYWDLTLPVKPDS